MGKTDKEDQLKHDPGQKIQINENSSDPNATGGKVLRGICTYNVYTDTFRRDSTSFGRNIVKSLRTCKPPPVSIPADKKAQIKSHCNHGSHCFSSSPKVNGPCPGGMYSSTRSCLGSCVASCYIFFPGNWKQTYPWTSLSCGTI